MANKESWEVRMATDFSQWSDSIDKNVLARLLEAAGEMKAARARALLAQCWGILSQAAASEKIPIIPDGLMADVLREVFPG